MDIFCTYCSAQKDHEPGNLPAIQRYQSKRINQIADSAVKLGIGFYILSGKYGLIESHMPIPYYNHLLQPDEIAIMVRKVGDQLAKADIQTIIFFTNPPEEDPNLGPYLEVIETACRNTNVNMTILRIQAPDLQD